MRVRVLVGSSLVLALSAASAPAQSLGPDKYFDAAGVRIRYAEQGAGEPIVLVHGFGNTAEIWANNGIAQDLARNYRVIAFDARGHGKSDKPHEPARYGREMALDVVRLLDHLGIQRAHVVGYSLGGYVVSQLLTLRPERFLSAALIAGSGRFNWDDARAQLAEVEASERERECISRSMLFRLAPINAPRPSEDSLKVLSAKCFADSTQDRFALAALTRSRADQAIHAGRRRRSQSSDARHRWHRRPGEGRSRGASADSAEREARHRRWSDTRRAARDPRSSGADRGAARVSVGGAPEQMR